MKGKTKVVGKTSCPKFNEVSVCHNSPLTHQSARVITSHAYNFICAEAKRVVLYVWLDIYFHCIIAASIVTT